MFFWNEEGIAWYRRAAAYNGFHRRLAEKIIPQLDPADTVCDLGCGIGQLALALSAHAAVTAVDIDPCALAVLREDAGPKLELLQADAHTLPATRCWDAVVLCFFGRITEGDHLDRYLSHCKKRLIAVISGTRHSAISPGGRSAQRKEHVSEVCAYLRARAIPYHLVETALDGGQPLESIAEAVAFVRHYAPNVSAQEAEAHARARLVPLDGGGYYLPNEKKIGILTIEKEELM